MPKRKRAPLVYQLKITLKDSKPAIWRRLQVPSDITLADLHEALQIAMGWTDSHLHQFVIGKTTFGQPDVDDLLECEDEEHFRLEDLIRAKGSRFRYEYDFGDHWVHQIVLEDLLRPDPAARYPRCTGGARACPPEDCGGMGGYAQTLAILAAPEHPEHDEIVDWLEADFDPERFDLAATNEALADALGMTLDESDAQTLRNAFLEVIEDQMRMNDPPETRQTYERLLAEGFPSEEAYNLIGTAVVSEVFSVLNDDEPYDRERYVRALHALPKLPWE